MLISKKAEAINRKAKGKRNSNRKRNERKAYSINRKRKKMR